MSMIGAAGTAAYGLTLVCGLLSRRWKGARWAACWFAIISAALMLYDGAALEVLAAGAIVPGLLLLGTVNEKEEAA